MDYHGESIVHLQGDRLHWPASFPTQGDPDLGQISANGGGGWPTDQVTIGTVGPYAYTQPDAHNEAPGQDWPNEGVPAQPPQSRFNHQIFHHDWDVGLRPTAYAPPQSRQSYGSNTSREASHESFFPSSSANSAMYHPKINGTSLPIPSYTVIVDNRSTNTLDTLMNYCPYSKASNVMRETQFDGDAHSEAFASSSSALKDQSALSGFVQFPWGQSHVPPTSTKNGSRCLTKTHQCEGNLFTCNVQNRKFTGPNAWLLQALMRRAGVNKHNEWDVMSKNFSHNAVFDNGQIWLKYPSEPYRRHIAKFVVRCQQKLYWIHSDGRCRHFRKHAAGGVGGRTPRDRTLIIDTAREMVYGIPKVAWKDDFELPSKHVSQETSVPESVLDFSTQDQSNLTLLQRAQTNEEDDPVSKMEPCGGDVFQCDWDDEALIPGHNILTQEHRELVKIFLGWWGVVDGWKLIEPSFTGRHGFKRYDGLTTSPDGGRKVALFIGWCRYWIGHIHRYRRCPYFRAKTMSACGSRRAAVVGSKPKGSSPDSGLQVATDNIYRMRPKDWRDEKLHSKIAAHKKKYGFPSE